MEQQNFEAQQALRKIQALLDVEGLKATNKIAVMKEIKRKNSSEPQKQVWSSWCTDGETNFLALLENGKLKLINKDKLGSYIIRSIK